MGKMEDEERFKKKKSFLDKEVTTQERCYIVRRDGIVSLT